MTQHSVQSHLHLKADEYDRSIRTLVPHYEEMLAKGVELFFP